MAEPFKPVDEQIIDGLINHYGYNQALKVWAQHAGYVDVPPDIDTFLDDDEFCGTFLGGKQLYPTWREYLRQIFPNPITSPFLEIAVTGCIGGGKSVFCSVGMFYDLFKILHMVQPQRSFGLLPTSPIMIAFINATMALSESVLYNQFIRWIYSSPFFVRQMAKVAILDKNKKKDLLPWRIDIISGSRARHALGQNVVMAMLDELNFQSQVVKNQASNNYAQLKNRIESRYGGVNPIIAGRLWLASSKTDETGYLEQYLKVLEESNRKAQVEGKDPPNLMICKSIWEIKERAYPGTYSDKKFKVFIGDQRRDPFIIARPGDSLGLPDDLVVDVPEDFREHFDRNLVLSLRDFAGVSTWGSYRFMSQESLVRAAARVKNPIYGGKDVVVIDFEDEYDQLINSIDIEQLKENLKNEKGQQSPCFIHYDIGITKDATGIAITRSLGEVQVNNRPNNLLTNAMTRDLLLQTVLAIAVKPRPGKEIPLSKLRNFFIHLIERGVLVVGLSADQFQSRELIQEAKKAGLIADTVSVDKTRDPYDYLKDCIHEQRISYPNNQILIREFLNLRDEGKKIDHPISDGNVTIEVPSKDVADAVAGSVWWCKENSGLVKGAGAYTQFAEHLKAAKREVGLQERMAAEAKRANMNKKWSGGRGR